jgi:hypothetical protein
MTTQRLERWKVAFRLPLVYALVILGGVFLYVLLGHFVHFHVASWHVDFGHYHPIE